MKLPPQAFEHYIGLGPDRSHAAVALHFNVSKRCVATRAVKENWKARVTSLEARAQENVEKKAIETIEQMKERHLKMMRVVQSKAIETLKAMPIDNAYQAVRALVSAVEQERVARGEPSERTAIDIERVIRKEYESCMLKPGAKDDWNFDA